MDTHRNVRNHYKALCKGVKYLVDPEHTNVFPLILKVAREAEKTLGFNCGHGIRQVLRSHEKPI